MARLDGTINYKVRGTKEVDNPTYLGIAKEILGLEKEEIQGITERYTINSYHDYKESKGTLLPGYSRKVIQRFKFTNLDLPCKDIEEFEERKQKELDYASILLKEGFEKAFLQRLKDHRQRKGSN
jgi:hypothetical protein